MSMLSTVIRKAALVTAIGLASIATAASADTLKIGTEGGYPPWSMVDASGQVTGFDADVGNALCEKLSMKCRFVVQAFDSLIPALQADRFDLIISGMSVTAERSKVINFSLPYVTEDSAFVVPASSNLIEIDDQDKLFNALAGKTVGVQSGTTQGAFLEKYAPDMKLKAYETQDQMQMDLSAGRLDATFSEVTPQGEFLAKSGKDKFAMADYVVKSSADPEILGLGIGAGINKENTELKSKVDTALCELITAGTIKTASEKWFGVDLSNYQACK